MKYKIMIAHQKLNELYDKMLALCELSLALDRELPNYLKAKTQALVTHDRIITDMVELNSRPGQAAYWVEQDRQQYLRIHQFFMARRERFFTR